MDMELIYLYHSGFACLGERYTLVFDFYEDSESPSEGVLHRELLHRPGRFYVFSSHSHADHFNPEVFRWSESRKDIVYVLSSDITESPGVSIPTSSVLHSLDKGDVFQDDFLCVRAFGSTDIGISFLVEVEGKRVFHAGDLNNWHWMEESDEAEWKGYESHFLRELQEIKRECPIMDVVMFPVDPRLGREYMRGAVQWVAAIQTGLFVPMHFDADYDLAAAFKPLAAAHGCECFSPSARGERRRISI